MSDATDRPQTVVTRCRHFWRKRTRVPTIPGFTFGPYVDDGEGGRVPSSIMFPSEWRPFCRSCAGNIAMRPMSEAEIRAVTGQ